VPDVRRTFDTRRGLGVHHSLVHGERIPNRRCASCGDSFYSEFDKKYCPRACRRGGVSFEGEANPNFRGAKESTECEICGASFAYYPSGKVGRFCPNCVENEPWQTPPVASGADRPRWNGGNVRRECVTCGDTVERYPSGFVSDVVLCSERCRRAWMSETFTGDGHPNWEGGGNEAYGSGWNALRKAALERDGYRCVVCGTSADDIGRNPDVHHIVPLRWSVASDVHERADAHRLENVVCLCVGCHRKAEFGKISAGSLRERCDVATSNSCENDGDRGSRPT